MINHPKKQLKDFVRKQLKIPSPPKHGRWSFAQEGEDVLLWRILDGSHQVKGTYVDVGCNHPRRFSNTAFFYQRGWRGVVIDPNPRFAEIFRQERPEDVYLNIGVANENSRLKYFSFEEDCYNTFSEEMAMELVNDRIQPEPQESEIEVRPLRQALLDIWPTGKTVDLLSIDAEGYDLAIVQSHDFGLFPVAFLFVESEELLISGVHPSPMTQELAKLGFHLVSKLWKSALYVHESRHASLGIRS